MSNVTVNQFRQDFPEFADIKAYLSSSIGFWLKIANGDLAVTPPLNGLLNQSRWKSQYNLATELFVAHNLAIEKLNSNAGKAGGVPGLATGPVTSKSVDKVSVSYDTSIASIPDGGHFNLTTYGTRLLWLINIFGMGPIQIGANCAFESFFTPSAYAGPYPGV